MKNSVKSILPIAAAVVIVVAVAVYVATHWNEIKARLTGDKSAQHTEGNQNSDQNQNKNGSQNAGQNGGSNNGSNQGLNFNSSGQPPQMNPNDPNNKNTGAVDFGDEDPAEPCPTKTNKYRRVLGCPMVPENVKDILKKQNFRATKEDCDIESRTTKITLGRKFIAWTLIQSNSCENKAYPQGLSEEKTYYNKDGAEVIYGDHFDLKGLEKYYLANVDLKATFDELGQRCPAAKESNRHKNLGNLSSELTKAQFRLVDNNKSVRLVMQTFMQGDRGRVCSLHLDVKDWYSFLVKDSQFEKNQKQREIFKDDSDQ